MRIALIAFCGLLSQCTMPVYQPIRNWDPPRLTRLAVTGLEPFQTPLPDVGRLPAALIEAQIKRGTGKASAILSESLGTYMKIDVTPVAQPAQLNRDGAIAFDRAEAKRLMASNEANYLAVLGYSVQFVTGNYAAGGNTYCPNQTWGWVRLSYVILGPNGDIFVDSRDMADAVPPGMLGSSQGGEPYMPAVELFEFHTVGSRCGMLPRVLSEDHFTQALRRMNFKPLDRLK
jgi:hypothetical protein